MARALVILAPGAEEMETVIVVDVLRRAGVDVVLAGLLGSGPVTCSRKVVLVPDAALQVVKDQAFDLVVLPGGADGTRRLAEATEVGKLLRAREERGGLTGAICAAPAALAAHGVFAKRKMTSHFSVADRVRSHAAWVDAPVVHDGSLVTSQGPGTSFAFALSLVAAVCGEAKAQEIRAPMLLRRE